MLKTLLIKDHLTLWIWSLKQRISQSVLQMLQVSSWVGSYQSSKLYKPLIYRQWTSHEVCESLRSGDVCLLAEWCHGGNKMRCPARQRERYTSLSRPSSHMFQSLARQEKKQNSLSVKRTKLLFQAHPRGLGLST